MRRYFFESLDKIINRHPLRYCIGMFFVLKQIHMGLIIRHKWKIACTGILFLGLLFGSCKNDDFSIGKYLVEPHTTAGMIDTITIKVTNLVAADSVVTSGKSIGFSGAYHDSQIGAVRAQSYIEFARTTDSETDRYAKFDSVTLVLYPNGDYYGDTLTYGAFKVYELAKRIEKQDDGNLYSTSTLPVGEQYADTTLKLRVKNVHIPKIQDSFDDKETQKVAELKKINEFEIKLPREFGERLFQGILKGDDNYNSENFLKTFPGLSVTAGTGSDCVHGLNLSDTACMIRIYYHVSTSYKEEKTLTFKSNPINSFYHIDSDRAKLPFYNMKSDPVSSTLTGNRGIIMSGSTPMYVRLEFPHLNNLLWLSESRIVKIQKATLYLRPIRHSFDTVPLPPRLNVFYFDPTSNTPLSSAIKPPSMGNQNVGPQTGNLPEDYDNIQRPDFPQYSFDVTDFIASQLGKTGYNKWALSLVIPPAPNETNARSSISENTLQRLVFGDQKYWYRTEHLSKENQIKLEVTYVVYND